MAKSHLVSQKPNKQTKSKYLKGADPPSWQNEPWSPKKTMNKPLKNEFKIACYE